MIEQAASAEEVLRYAFSQGPGRDFAAPSGPPERPLTTSFGTLPERVATDRMCRLVWGTVDLLEETSYPGPCPLFEMATENRIQHALVMAFGLQHREPSNLFNDHRSCASVRSKFPVHTFVHTDDRAWLLDVYRHGLLPVGDACPVFPADQPVHVALAGRYTHLPSLYGRLRGPLTELELGISLRSLCVALEVFGLSGELRLPGLDAGRLMAQLGLDPPSQWSAPITVAVEPTSQPPAAAGRAARSGAVNQTDDDDPTLEEVVAVNRTSLEGSGTGRPHARRGMTRAIPAGLSAAGRPAALSWSEVQWRRSAGRMPRQLSGFSGRRRAVAAAAATDALRWLAVPPPTPLLEEIARQITVTAFLQDVAGFATGQYRLERDPARLELARADASLPGRLEACYGHGQGPTVGCAVRNAAMVWLLSVDVGSLVESFGPGAWTLAQFACGWMAHGLCLSAAAHGLYARPSRAFDEILLQPVVNMVPGEMILLSVVSGVGRFVEPLLDLRA